MEYIAGDDLSQLLRRIGRLSSERAIEISRQLCIGLHAIHDSGILHRDFKPANIIIDAKGKARITDFGIAGIVEEISKDEIRAGTPAYMSPEQIAGREISSKSDIYSLGLVLYEIFTGKRAFEADSIPDLIRKQLTATPTDPSEFVKGIDPLVEKVIFQCLEKDAKDRPPSALHVAMALPGGNPLQVALEAGETPSPEMVAAAPKEGSLKPPVALGLLFLFIVAFVGMAVLHQYIKTYNLIPVEKSADVLAERAETILEKFGYSRTAADTAYRFEQDFDFSNYGNREKYPEMKKILGTGRTLENYFLYRQSPIYFEPKESGRVTEFEPPLTKENMANVKLDPKGRLVEFIAVPPKKAVETTEAKIDWKAIFDEAGLEVTRFKETNANFTPPVFADERRAWEGTAADLPEIPLSVEAAFFAGKPVYFRVVAPWNLTEGESGISASIFYKIGVVLIISIYFLVIIGSVFLARRNLKSGRGDMQGGLKLTGFLFFLHFVGQMIYADHVPTLWGELSIIYQAFAYSLISALFIGVMYIALEPFVRRHWSELLISWNRLLQGDFRDPLIGRDILIGGLLGIAHTIGINFGSVLVSQIIGIDDILNSAYHPPAINGFPGVVYVVTASLANAAQGGFILLFVLLGLYLLLRRKNLSVFLLWFLIFGLQTLIFVLTQHWGFVFAAAFNALFFVIALSRFGLVGVISFFVCFNLSYHFPVTFDGTSPYFPSTVATFFIAFALAFYSFYISTAGQPVFGKEFLNE